MDYKSFMNFDKMIVPIIIKVIFWFGVGFSVLTGIVIFISGLVRGIDYGSIGLVFGGLIGGPIAMVLMIVWTRVISEITIIAFQINDSLTDIKLLLEKK